MEIEVEALRFGRDRRLVLDIPSLRFRSGRRTAILGPNGAGKTTLLRLIAALERPQSGEVRIGGRPVRPDPATRQRIAFHFQEPVFLARSVRANLDLALGLRRVPEGERSSRIEEAARRLGIEPLLDRRAAHLSGGEARRASLARALCLRAPIVLLDEPLAGLDPPSRARLAAELPAVLRAFAATTILVTQDREEALRLADDLVVLVDGRVRAAGDKREVFLDPRDGVVAALLGYSLLTIEGRRIAVPPGGVRSGDGPSAFWVTVEEVVDLVERQEVVGHIGEDRIRVRLEPGAAAPSPGDRIRVHAERVIAAPDRRGPSGSPP